MTTDLPDLNVRQAHIVQYLLSNPEEVLTIKTHQNKKPDYLSNS